LPGLLSPATLGIGQVTQLVRSIKADLSNQAHFVYGSMLCRMQKITQRPKRCPARCRVKRSQPSGDHGPGVDGVAGAEFRFAVLASLTEMGRGRLARRLRRRSTSACGGALQRRRGPLVPGLDHGHGGVTGRPERPGLRLPLVAPGPPLLSTPSEGPATATDNQTKVVTGRTCASLRTGPTPLSDVAPLDA
jgi:hypothetical protein